MRRGVGGLRNDRRRSPLAVDPVASGPGSALGVLTANTELVRLVAGFTCVTVAEWAYVTALSIHAYRTNGAIAVGFVGGRLFLAAVSSLFPLSVLRDRATGRSLSEIAALGGLLVGISAAVTAAGTGIAPLLILLGLEAVVASQYRPALSATIPGLSRSPQEMVVTVGALSTTKTLSQSLGAVLGGVLLAVVSPQAVFAGAAAVFVCAALTNLPLWWRQPTSGGDSGSAVARDPGSGPLRELLADLRDRQLASVLVASGLRTFVRGMWIAVAVIASLKLLHAGSTGVGLLMLAAGAGSLVATPISSRLVTRRRIGSPAAVALVSCGVPLALIAAAPFFGLCLALVAAWGVGMAVADVALSSILYRVVEAPLLPRVTGTIESAKLALEGLGGFLAPVLASTVGVRPALLVASLPLPLLVSGGWETLHQVDATAADRASLLEMIHRVPCLRRLNMGSLDSLAGRLTSLVVSEAGSDVVTQGEPGSRFYIIKEGSAEVLIDGYRVDSLRRGQGFGERALLRGTRRAATVRSTSPMQLLVLERDDFLIAIVGTTAGHQPAQGESAALDVDNLGARERSDCLSRSSLLSHMENAALGLLAERSLIDRWPAGATIVQQGEEGDRYFLILDGHADVLVDGRKVSELLPGDQFGEIALIHSVPRSATVMASSPVVTLSLHRDDFIPTLRSRLASG